MLFDRFIFVLYILFGYIWFLLGTLYETPYRYLSIVSMMISLMTIVVISLYQLQILINQDRLDTNDKWSTIAWSCAHLFLCSIFCLDGLEWANAVIIFGLCGLIMTVAILVVSSCACFVIMKNGEDWHAHVHLVCIMFWVIVQYMDIRLPSEEFQFMTALPIALMTCVRFVEQPGACQMLLWCITLVFHILRDQHIMGQFEFYWLLTFVIIVMSTVNIKSILIITGLPFAVLPTLLYICLKKICGTPARDSIISVVKLYNEVMTKELDLVVLPFDQEFNEEDWSERL